MKQAEWRQQGRSLDVDAVLRLTSCDALFGAQFAIDPTGRFLAASIHLGAAEAPRYCVPFLAGGERGELWLIDVKTRERRHVEKPPGVGLFSPLWSADGRWIAVAVTDGFYVRPGLVDTGSCDVRILTERNLGLLANKHPFYWVSTEELACRLLDNGVRPEVLDVEYRGPLKAMVAWPQAWSGKTTTASSLRSDELKADAVPSEVGEPLVINVPDGVARGFADGEKIPPALTLEAENAEPDARSEQPEEEKGLPPLSTKVATHQATGQTVFHAREDDGTRLLLRVEGSDNITTLFETDLHLAGISVGGSCVIDYYHPCCGSQRMRCIFPPDFEHGQRRPAVMFVYPGQRVGERPVLSNHINNPSFFNLQLLAARGFVVLVPAMPSEAEELSHRPIIETLAEAALPALDAAEAAGWVDRDQVHLLGQSMGGWAVMALLAETSVFRSGIALAGIYNLMGFYGQFDVRFRYDGQIEQHPIQRAICETQFHLKEPLWKHPQAYQRNSPLFAVEHISSPVLMFHGDQDYVPISQAEEMFTALRFAGKKAELVRYWGEGHLLSSPANVRDAWGRIFRWLESGV